MKDGLNVRQMKFVDGIMQGMTLIDAYTYAGYKSKPKSQSAYTTSSQLLRNPKILEELRSRIESHKRSLQAQFVSLADAARSVYSSILQLKAGDNDKLLELQRKVAEDMFDRMGTKAEEKVKHSGQLDVTFHLFDVDLSNYPE